MTKLILLLGFWRAVLFIPGDEIPFNFEVTQENNAPVLYIINAEERIRVDEILLSGDSVFISLPVFNSEIRARVNSHHLRGHFINHARSTNKKMDFEAFYGLEFRFKENPEAQKNITIDNRYKVIFSPGTDDEYPAIGLFEQDHTRLTGTFLTSTGDYRYLQGNVIGDSIKLSCFDGAHAFLFQAKLTGSELNGVFRSGSGWQEPWHATVENAFDLPDPYSLTFLKEGFDRLYFKFPDTDSTLVSLDDVRFKNKVTVVQILGSWCPNCKDESVFLTEFHKEYPQVEIVGLAFERGVDFQASAKTVSRMKTQLGINYPVLIAGKANKKEAGEALPMLNKVLSFPTTIFLDKNGTVRNIHTGFFGPATGDYYTLFKKEFYSIISEMLEEK